MSGHDLVLYFKPTCPFCNKVLSFMQEKRIEIPVRNTAESDDIRQELIGIGGKPQVPCLVIDGKAMYESDDIIRWLDKHFERQDR